MHVETQQAGPGLGQGNSLLAGSEAAGPAHPRLVLEEIGFRSVGGSFEARTVLTLSSHRFTGIIKNTNHPTELWKLIAAAAVAAMQQYLDQCTSHPPYPQIELISSETITLEDERKIVHAIVRIAQEGRQTHLVGSALVKKDLFSAAAAAALDAASRRLGLFRLPKAPPTHTPEQVVLPTKPIPPEPVPEPTMGSRQISAPPIAERPECLKVLHESPPQSSPLHAQSTTALSLGVEISPTSIRATVADASGYLHSESRRPSLAAGESEIILARAVDAAQEALARFDSSAGEVGGVGVAVPCRLRTREGICISSNDFPTWQEVQLAPPFLGAFGLPVVCVSTNEAAAFAEVCYGAAKELENVIFLRVSDNIEAAIIIGGKIALREADPGQIGHMVIEVGGPRCTCGETGCWQALAGRDALIARVVRAIRNGTPSAISGAVENRLGAITPALICRMASAGDGVARAALEETGRCLAVGIANLVTLFDPEAVIVESAPSPLGIALIQSAGAALQSSPRAEALSRCSLLSPALGDSGPVLGAAAWACLEMGRETCPSEHSPRA